MVFITIMFGKKYIDSYFDNALYSICRQNNFEQINEHNEAVFLILTTVESEKFIRDRLGKLGKWALNCKFDVRSFNVVEQEDQYFKRILPLVMLRYAISYCINKDKKFFLLCPDTVYSSEVLGYALEQYLITGRIVSIYNGKTTLGFNESDKIAKYFNERQGFINLYIDNWAEHANLMVLKDSNPENVLFESHAIIKNDYYISIYTSNPNPTLGKFEMQDLLFFERAQSFEAWDHYWKDRLAEQHRLFVQTNLELGMSIELDDSSSTVTGDRAMQIWRERQRSIEAVRNVSDKFLEAPRMPSDYRKHEFGSRLSMVNFSARLD